MNRRIVASFLITMFIVSMVHVNVYAVGGFAGGDGSEGNPYQIATAEQLNSVRNYSDSYFVLNTDIDLSSYDNWEPIASFGGTFDGQGYKIKNLTISRASSSNVALFGQNSGTISNVILSGVDITGNMNVGGLVGTNNGTVETSYITGQVTSNLYFAGGMIGTNSGTVTKCFSEVHVEGTMGVGVLIGSNQSLVNNSYVSGQIIQNTYRGVNIAGMNGGTITKCYAIGQPIYGLVGVGASNSSVTDSYYNKKIINEGSSGDGEAKTIDEMKTESTYSGWDFTDVWEMEDGQTYPHLKDLPPILVKEQSFLDVTGSDSYLTWEFDENVFKGTGHISIYKVSDDTKVEAIDITDTQKVSIVDNAVTVKVAATFVDNERYYILIDDTCFKDASEKYFTGIRDKNKLNFYFYQFASGNGSYEKPYQIETEDQLNAIRNFQTEKYYVLSNDIDLTIDWNPIEDFTGTIDGQGHKINNLKINVEDKDNVGLFGKNKGTIKNISLTNADVTALRSAGAISGGSYVAALVAYNTGKVETCNVSGNVKGITNTGGLIGINSGGIVSKCYSTTNVEGQGDYINNRGYYIGGLAGKNSDYGLIEYSYSTGDVTGDAQIGGLVGNAFTSGKIKNSYSTGNVTGREHVGGLLGRNYSNSSVSNSYSIGNVTGETSVGGLIGYESNGSVENSYYDKETSGQNDTGKGEPKTTIEMKQQETYSGLDFDSVWFVDENNTYPSLRCLASDNADVIEMKLNPSVQINGQEVTANVLSDTAKIKVDLTVSDYATWKLYKDEVCTDEIADKTINLEIGVNTAYIKVTSQSKTITKVYTLKITRILGKPNLQSAIGGEKTVKLKWDPLEGTEEYQIYQSTTSGGYTSPSATVSKSVYEYDITNLSNGTTYYFAVKASANGITSEYSNEISATPMVKKPNTPTIISVTPGDRSVKLTWDKNLVADQYEIYKAETSGGYKNSTATVSGSVYEYNITNLNNGTTYYFVIKASNQGVKSDYSNEVSATPMVKKPSTPVITGIEAGDRSVKLAWDSVIGAESYKIYTSETSNTYGVEAKTATVTQKVYEYTVTNLTNGTPYFFVITSINQGGESPYSNEVTALPKTVPSSPTNVIAVAGNGQATVSFDTPKSNGGSEITKYTVTSNPDNISVTGKATSLIIKGLTNGKSYTFTVKASNIVGDSEESEPSNSVTPVKSSTPQDPDTQPGSDADETDSESGSGTHQSDTKTEQDTSEVEIIVNGKKEIAATAKTEMIDNKVVITITVDQEKVKAKLDREEKPSIVIPVNNEVDEVVGKLNAQLVKDMGEKEATLEMKTEKVSYILPASKINIEGISEAIGTQVQLKDIEVNIQITKAPEATIKKMEERAKDQDQEVIISPIEFEITCTSQGKEVKVDKFKGYIDRVITIPDGVDPSKITTAIVFDNDGTFEHVPTVVEEIDGKSYAKIKSLTNSTYSVIYNPKSFKDVENHWSKEAVNDMGSRLIISGVTDELFEPNRDITRAEFATILVRGLGLMRTGEGKDIFEDVTKTDWYYDAVSKASEYGLVSGYENGEFKANNKITRQEAMVMIAKALKTAELNVDITDEEIEGQLRKFKDNDQISKWAEESVALCIENKIISGYNNNLNPKENITRAETATIIRKMLQTAQLIY